MGVLTKAKEWITATDLDELDEDEEILEEEEVEAPKKQVKAKAPKASRGEAGNRPLPSSRDCAISVFSPKSYQEATKIGTDLKNRKAAIVNVADLPKEQSKRITDFLQGIVFAIDGNYYIVGDKVILYVPKNIDVNDVDGTSTLEEE